MPHIDDAMIQRACEALKGLLTPTSARIALEAALNPPRHLHSRTGDAGPMRYSHRRKTDQ